MAKNFMKMHRITSFLCIVLITIGYGSYAQNTPEIPASVSFGGILVNFDKDAQNIIDEDIKNLMSNKKFWEEKMERAILYFPIVEGILMDEEVPIDFKYLAVQESSFRPDVVSTSNAVGFWQFKPETARELNLRIDNQIDERKNISSSTHAAAWYLKRSNQQFNNWIAALYSYYQGAGGVKKMVPSNWSYAKEVTLDGKTDRYMLRFFAHKIALEAGLERFKSNNKIILLESEYGKGMSFDEIAKSLSIDLKELENYNHWVADGRIPTDREYLLTVPVPLDKAALVREKLSLKPVLSNVVVAAYEETGFPVLKKSDKQSDDKNDPVLYEINGLPGIEARAGDTPKTLAKAGHVRVPRFKRYNDMLQDMPLVTGNIYYLAKKNKKAATPFHTARPGDTWQTVSQQYGIRLVSLLKYNRTVSRNYPIQEGQVLWLTKKRPRRQPVEIITPKPETPVESVPAVASTIPVQPTPPSNVPASSGGSIPDKPSGRKKYTPVLVEKSESNVAVESPQAEPVTTPKAIEPVKAVEPAIVNKPVAPAVETNDRVVIITQDNEDASFKSVNENVVKKNDPAVRVESKPTATTTYPSSPSTSVYARQQKEAAERAAAERLNNPEKSLNNPEKKSTVTKAETFHIVKGGETFFSVARKYGMEPKQLDELNNLGAKRAIIIGQKLRVTDNGNALADNRENDQLPKTTRNNISEPKPVKEDISPVKDDSKGKDYYTVQGGQSYYSISRMHNISVKELMDLNNLTESDKLISGQRLRIKKGNGSSANQVAKETTVKSSSNSYQTHIVAAGETLYRIALNYGANVEDIKKLNSMSGNSVMVGQKLKVPQK